MSDPSNILQWINIVLTLPILVYVARIESRITRLETIHEVTSGAKGLPNGD